MKLRRPPIVEAWIEFHLHAAEEEETWPAQIPVFFENVQGEFPRPEYAVAERVTIEERHPTGLPKKISGEQSVRGAKAYCEDRTRCVQIEEDALVLNLARQGQDYPGFDVLVDQALRLLAQYCTSFRPQFVREVALHYVDLVRIPRSGAPSLKPDDYFNIGVRVPRNGQWPLSGFATQMLVPLEIQSASPSHLAVRIESEPLDARSEEFRLRVDWHAMCHGVDTLDASVLESRLRSLRDTAWRFFKQSVTPLLWNMFEPIEEG